MGTQVHRSKSRSPNPSRAYEENGVKKSGNFGLKHELKGCWSRRIDREHRVVYEVLPDKIRIVACRYHY